MNITKVFTDSGFTKEKVMLLILVLVAAVILIWPTKKPTVVTSEKIVMDRTSMDYYSFAQYQEMRLEEIIDFTYGEDFCEVMVTLDEKNKDSYPEIKGVVISLREYDEKKISEIIYSVKALYGVEVNQIKIICRR